MLLMRLLLSSIIVFAAVIVIKISIVWFFPVFDDIELIRWGLLWSMGFSSIMMLLLPALIVLLNRKLKYRIFIFLSPMCLPLIGGAVSYLLLKKQIIVIRGDIK